MKNTIASILILMAVCFSCKEQPEPEQTVFENLPSCCRANLPCNDTPVEKKDITGILVGGLVNAKGELIYYNIRPDSVFNISDKVLPMYKWYGGIYSICNIPEKLINAGSPQRVKFSCKFIYLYVAPINGQIPQSSGYPVELSRIEIIK